LKSYKLYLELITMHVK